MITTTNTVTSAMAYSLLRCKLETTMLTSLCPVQIVGFVPVEQYNDCRPELSYCNPVFAETIKTDEIFNDKNSFLFEFQSSGDSVTYRLEKYDEVGESWEVATIISDNTYGLYYDIGDIADFPLYSGVVLYWFNILATFGQGRYRLRLNSTIEGSACLMYSKCFCLNEYSCEVIDRTIRFEAYMSGKIGSKDDNFKTFDLCELNWYDSIRTKGYFGDETPEQEVDNIKYSNGEMKQVRDEEIRKYTATLWKVPMYIYQRFNRYGLYANRLLVTDYNHVNPDYHIQQKEVITDGGAEPTFFNEQSVRLVTSRYKLSDRYETGIKSNCCG